MSKISFNPERSEDEYWVKFEIESFQDHLKFTRREGFGGPGPGFEFKHYQECYSFTVPRTMFGQLLAAHLAEDVEEYMSLAKSWSTEDWGRNFTQALGYFQDAEASFRDEYCYEDEQIPTKKEVAFEWSSDKGLRLTRYEDVTVEKLSNGRIYIEPAPIDYTINVYSYPSLLSHFGFTRISSVFHNLFQGRNEFWDELERWIVEQYYNENYLA